MTRTQTERALGLLRRAVEITTVNPEGLEAPLAEFLADYAREAGLTAEVQPFAPGRANVTARLKGREDGPALLLNGHLDTVPFGARSSWDTPPEQAVERDGKLFGRGVSDMKGGLCAALFALCELAREGFTPRNDIYFAGTGDEESLGLGAQAVVDSGLLDRVGRIVIGEPTGNQISVASKGTLWLEFTIGGRTSHGAYPQEGVNAAELACALAAELKPLVEGPGHPYLGRSTCTLTKIEGGVKVNVVPDACTACFDIRTVPQLSHDALLGRVEELARRLEGAHPGARIAWRALTNRMAVETAPGGPLVRELSDAVRQATGTAPALVGTAFFSDASVFLKRYDLPSVLFGPGESDEAHKPNESLSLEKYAACVESYQAFLRGQ